ncbi:MAG: DUF4062 domain-containing protein [Saprospiraceae bacterium]|nr:DUF4062 domain-containing protein [Saprospiraceae bacterium]
MASIKTPDQRVRVFISSTINELADERKAAREAILNLRLIPVFFEAGARPHPPRDLYSAYLDQSHIFLGIYWNSYGWIAPGSEISGLEDEYRLCGKHKPKLIYVKRTSEIQPRLKQLLTDIQNSDSACYQYFDDAKELQKHIENDLSVLLSEIFENALSDQNHSDDKSHDISDLKPTRIELIPHIQSEIYGRDEELKRVSELLLQDKVNLVTLLGAGGTGKTVLAIHIAQNIKDAFADGVAFVSLASISDYRLVEVTIGDALGLQDSGKQAMEQTIVDYLSDKSFLLVLDNFEQVIGATKFISNLLLGCQYLKILITSRTSLHIRTEHIFNLHTLAVPVKSNLTAKELYDYPATQLFVERALQVNPLIDLNQENVTAIKEICERLDGLPLAIELAAARTRFFQPALLISRIVKTLDMVNKGQKDLPERQQTLRAAIEWSYNLLSEETQFVFRQLGIFKSSWTLDAADVVLNAENIEMDIEEMTERLLDVSLIKQVSFSSSSEPRFNMLQTVLEYAREMLDKSPEAIETKLRFAQHFLKLCEDADGKLWVRNGEVWLDQIEADYPNIRAAFYYFIELNDYESAWRFIPVLSGYWTVRGGFSDSFRWIEDAGIKNTSLWYSENISPEVRGKTLLWAGYCTLFLFDFEMGFTMLNEAQVILSKTSDKLSLAFAYCLDGCYGSYMMRSGSSEKIELTFQLAEEVKDSLLLCMLYCWSIEYYRQLGQYETMSENLEKARRIAAYEGNIYILGAIYILQHGLNVMNGDNDYHQTLQDGINMYNLFPEKGFIGLKSAAMQSISYAYYKMGQLDEAYKYLLRGYEYGRLSGEVESLFYGVMDGSILFFLMDKNEKAFRLRGALDNFLAVSGYPLTGGSQVQYDEIKILQMPVWDNALHQKWYNEGKSLSLSEAIIFAMHD